MSENKWPMNPVDPVENPKAAVKVGDRVIGTQLYDDNMVKSSLDGLKGVVVAISEKGGYQVLLDDNKAANPLGIYWFAKVELLPAEPNQDYVRQWTLRVEDRCGSDVKLVSVTGYNKDPLERKSGAAGNIAPPKGVLSESCFVVTTCKHVDEHYNAFLKERVRAEKAEKELARTKENELKWTRMTEEFRIKHAAAEARAKTLKDVIAKALGYKFNIDYLDERGLIHDLECAIKSNEETRYKKTKEETHP